MKKLERLLDKLIGDKRPVDIVKDIILLIEIIMFTIIATWIATFDNYIFLAIMIFIIVGLIKESFFGKELFKRLNNYLEETPKATTLIFLIIFAVILILSWKHFIGVIFSAILAIMFADYIDN